MSPTMCQIGFTGGAWDEVASRNQLTERSVPHEAERVLWKAGRCAMALSLALSSIPAKAGAGAGRAPVQKPNIILILSDDFGYSDAGVYGGGPNRGTPTPNIDRLASEGMTFFTFYAQPSYTPGRAAVQTGRIPNRSGMTTVTFQGQPGGLPKGEWTLASVLKLGGYQTFSPVSGISGSRTTRYPLLMGMTRETSILN